MSRLFCTEQGRALIANNEEITRWRWARKGLKLPAEAAKARADLWLYLNMYDGNRLPLCIRLNGRALSSLKPEPSLARWWSWHRVAVPAGRLKEGMNEIVLSCDTPAMNGWMLGVENGHRNPRSWLSADQGASWRNEHLGAHGALRGEYLIRIRSHAPGLAERRPPAIMYEDPSHPRVRELLSLLPKRIRSMRDPWRQVLALRTWVAKSWTHDPFGRSYSPWDPWTVLDWAKRGWGHGQEGKVAMCVHFAAVFAPLAAALGHLARCLAITPDFNTGDGHFMAEVWDERLGKWILHDPNYDIHYEDGQPLSAIEIADLSHQGESLEKRVKRGPGIPRKPRRVVGYLRVFLTGRPFRITGIWARNNYVSDPAAAPPNHGSIAYCETDFVWYSPDGMDLAPMFPFRTGSRRYFEKAPSPSS